MNIVLKYAAAIGVLVGLLNTYFVYNRLKKEAQKNVGIGEKQKMNKYIKWYGICFTVPFLLIQIFQILGNYNTVFFIFLLDFNNIFYVLGFSSMILFWGILIYTVIIKNGAEFISKYHKAFGRNLPADAKLLKLITIGIVLIGLFVLLFANHITEGAITQFELSFQ